MIGLLHDLGGELDLARRKYELEKTQLEEQTRETLNEVKNAGPGAGVTRAATQLANSSKQLEDVERMLARPLIPRALKNACLVRNDMWTISEDQLLDSAKLDGRLMKTTFLKISVATAFPYKAFEAAPANSVSLKVGVGKNAKSAYEAQRAKKGEGERSPLSKSVIVCGRYGQFVNRWVESGRQQMLVIENAGRWCTEKRQARKVGTRRT